MNHSTRGVSLVEVIVALALLSGGIVALMGVFKSIARGVTANRTRTLATSLGQERIEAMKSISYYRLHATSSPVVIPGLTPAVYSDSLNYSEPETSVGGLVFNRYTVVDKVKKGLLPNSLETVPWNDPDTGLKRVLVTVVWVDNGVSKQFVLANLYENPYRAAATSSFSGIVSSTNSIPLTNALVEIVENPAWRSPTDGLGHYRIGAQPATYSLRASAPGYFNSVQWNILLTGTPQVVPFQLSRKSSVTVSGTVWKNDHLVISQVVGSFNRGVNYASGDEWVEIYNPTTWTWTAWSASAHVGLMFQRRIAHDPDPRAIDIQYNTTFIPQNSFFLFANTGTVHVGAYSRNADAVWVATSTHNQIEFSTNRIPEARFSLGDPNIIPVWEDYASGPLREGEGSLGLYTYDTVVGTKTWDVVGWEGGGGGGFNPGRFEGTVIDASTNLGLNNGEQLCRFTSTHSVVDGGIRAPAMDSGNNEKDWDYSVGIGPNQEPKNSGDFINPIAGTPVVGANVFADDGLSAPVQTVLVVNGGGHPDMAKFNLGSVATGTWTVSGSSGSAYGSAVVNTFGSLTTRLFLTTSTSGGFVSGHVTSNGGSDLVGIRVATLSTNKDTNSSGMYFLSVPPGLLTLIANPGAEDPSYVEARKTVTVVDGQLTSGVDFSLAGGIRLRGRMTIDGINPLPDVPVKIVNTGSGLEFPSVLSRSDGYFETAVPTGTYVVSPLPESTEAVVPPSITVGSSTGGDTVWSSTFTISSAYGSLRGRVLLGSEVIPSGVLIYASPTPLTGFPLLPPLIDDGVRSGSLSCYMATSRSDGTYELRARGESPPLTYHIYGWYTLTAGSTTTVVRQTTASLVPGGDVFCPDLIW
jgi:type II secretory pathway pseudopilin PulG